jgi:hypothetical protein
MTHKTRKKNFHYLKFWMFSFGAEGFSFSLDVLYGGTGIRKLQFLIKKNIKIFLSATKFFHFWSSKPCVRFGIQPKMLDLDHESRIRIRNTGRDG